MSGRFCFADAVLVLIELAALVVVALDLMVWRFV